VFPISVAASFAARTLAGGRGRGFGDGSWNETLFDRLVGVAVVSTGDIVIVDTFNHRIRLVHPLTGTTRTLSGSGRKGLSDGDKDTAEFHNPGAVAVATCPKTGVEAPIFPPIAMFAVRLTVMVLLQEIIIADTCNHALRRVSLSDGRVTTLAGCKEGFRDGPAGEALFAFPEGVAASGHLIYVVDTDNNRPPPSHASRVGTHFLLFLITEFEFWTGRKAPSEA